MTDTDKLKRLAEAAIDEVCNWECDSKAGSDFIAAANPHAILALIAENERLRARNIERAASLVDVVLERDEAAELLRECLDAPMEPWDRVRAFLARIDAAE